MKNKENQIETDCAVEQFLANGGEIVKLAYGKSGIEEGSGYSPWGKKRSWSKKKPVETPAVEGTADSTSEEK